MKRDATGRDTIANAAAQRSIGVVLILTSATVFSTAGLFTKGVTADAWAVIFWRGLFAVGFAAIWIAWRGNPGGEWQRMGWSGLAVAIVSALATAAFISAFKLTTIANVVLIYAAAPFVAAAVAWMWMHERPTGVAMTASAAAFAGVAIVLGGSSGGSALVGDLLAMTMTLLMSVLIVIYRRYPATPTAGPMALSSLLLLPAALLFGDPLSAPAAEIPVLGAFGLVFAIASTTLTAGAKRLPAPETALLSALETPFAPLWGWLLLSEVPSGATIIGGTVILAAIFGHEAIRYRGKESSVG